MPERGAVDASGVLLEAVGDLALAHVAEQAAELIDILGALDGILDQELLWGSIRGSGWHCSMLITGQLGVN